MDKRIDLRDYFGPEPDCIHEWLLVSTTNYDTTGGRDMICSYRCKLCHEEKAVIFYDTTNISITGNRPVPTDK